MALSVGVGLGVLHELMAAEVDEVVGPNGVGKSTTIRMLLGLLSLPCIHPSAWKGDSENFAVTEFSE